MTAVLIDTNVLIYAHDRGEPDKQQQAIVVLAHLLARNSGWISVQSLSEFFSISTRGHRPKLTIAQAAQEVEYMARAWHVLDLTPQIVLEAVRGVRVHQMSYWDAQIWATAKLNQIPVVFTEDIQSAEVLEGVPFVNPFAAEFAIADWA